MTKKLIKKALSKLGYGIHKIQKGEFCSEDPFETQKHLMDSAGVVNPIILDIGAHHGSSTVKYKAIFPESKVFCFEPFPDSFEVLQKKFSEEPSVRLFQSAVSTKPGAQKFYTNNLDATNSLLPRPSSPRRYYPQSADSKSVVDVSVISIDKFVDDESIKNVNILKLDIQGGELQALRGADRLLKESLVSIIFTEIMFIPHYEGGVLFHDLCGFLEGRNYSLFNIYELRHARNGQVRYGDAIFINEQIRSSVIDKYEEEQ